MLYRILMRLAIVLAIIPPLGYLFVAAMIHEPMHRPDAFGLAVMFGPAALVTAVAWIIKPR